MGAMEEGCLRFGENYEGGCGCGCGCGLLCRLLRMVFRVFSSVSKRSLSD